MIYSAEGKTGFVILQCEDCGLVRKTRRNTNLLKKNDHPCRSCSNKRNGIAKRGKHIAHNKGASKPLSDRRLGNKYVNHHGYYEVWLGPDSSKYGRKDGYVLEHRKVAQDELGRTLLSGEVVHHIDGNKLNNHPDNLFVCEGMGEHRQMHNSLESVAFELYAAGYILFDKEKSTYNIAPHVSNGMVEPGEFRGSLRPNKLW